MSHTPWLGAQDESHPLVGFAGVSHAPWLGAQDSSRPLVRLAGLITPFGWVYRRELHRYPWLPVSLGNFLLCCCHQYNLSIDLLLPRKSAYSSCDTTD